MDISEVIRDARRGRCLLRERWEEAVDRPGREQLKLAKALVKIKPASIEKHGRRVPCEPTFELRPKDRRRLVDALLRDGVPDAQILASVPGLTRRTFNRVKADAVTAKSGSANGSVERRIGTKRNGLVGTPQTAYVDATSGANLEAEKRFRELVAA